MFSMSAVKNWCICSPPIYCAAWCFPISPQTEKTCKYSSFSFLTALPCTRSLFSPWLTSLQLRWAERSAIAFPTRHLSVFDSHFKSQSGNVCWTTKKWPIWPPAWEYWCCFASTERESCFLTVLGAIFQSILFIHNYLVVMLTLKKYHVILWTWRQFTKTHRFYSRGDFFLRTKFTEWS